MTLKSNIRLSNLLGTIIANDLVNAASESIHINDT